MFDLSAINLDDEGEINFVIKSWKGCELAKETGLPRKISFDKIQDAFNKVLARGAEFRCVRNPTREEQLFGFAVVEGPVAHFVYVKRWLRRQGVATQLLHGCEFATYHTEMGNRLIEKLKLRRIDL